MLLGFNVQLSCLDFFQLKVRDPFKSILRKSLRHSKKGSDLKCRVSNNFFSLALLQMPDYQPFSTYPFAMNSTLFVGALLYTFHSSRFEASSWICGTFITQAFVMLLIPLTANVGGPVAYWACFALLAVFGLVSGANQTALFDLNAKLPKSYIAAFLTSQGLSGVVANLLKLAGLTMLTEGADTAFK